MMEKTSTCLNVVELFCGNGVVSRAFKDRDHNVFSVDIRKRKGVCEPDLRIDIMKLSRALIPFDRVDVVWASPPCDVWSYASGNIHWCKDGSPKSEKCRAHILLLEKCLALIEDLRAGYFFIENPRGFLRNYPLMINFLKKHRAVIKTVTYSSYGLPIKKPTNIFTNALDIKFKRQDSYGRGAKNKAVFRNITRCQVQKVPEGLADEFVTFCENKPGEVQDRLCSPP